MSEPPNGFVTANHALLFAEEADVRCDVCGADLSGADAAEDDGGSAGHTYDVPGRGLLVWTRGEERRYQEPPLCPTCAAAIGVSALSRWEIEEEEG